MNAPLHSHIPYDPFAERPLPGVQPLEMADWLVIDETFAGQMAERERRLADPGARFLRLLPGAEEAAEELLDTVLGQAYPGAGAQVERPDGTVVTVDRARPMETLGRLVQEDLCLMQKRGDAHVLTAAVLCFPASWRLEDKIGRPLIGIHEPVAAYDEGIARRVQRLFDGVQVGRPLWRFNRLWYVDPDLCQPRSIHERRPKPEPGQGGYLRSERQCIVRLEKTNAVVFSIHTYVMSRAAVLAQGLDTRGT